jgi:hypothetical protein
MNNNVLMFLYGSVIGVIVFSLVLSIFDVEVTRAGSAQRKIHTEAVSRGYGEWVIKTNDFDVSTPKTEFRWK